MGLWIIYIGWLFKAMNRMADWWSDRHPPRFDQSALGPAEVRQPVERSALVDWLIGHPAERRQIIHAATKGET